MYKKKDIFTDPNLWTVSFFCFINNYIVLHICFNLRYINVKFKYSVCKLRSQF